MSDEEVRRAERAAKDDPDAALELEMLKRREGPPPYWACCWIAVPLTPPFRDAEKVRIISKKQGWCAEAWRAPIYTLDGFAAVVRESMELGRIGDTHIDLVSASGLVLTRSCVVDFLPGWLKEPGEEPQAPSLESRDPLVEQARELEREIERVDDEVARAGREVEETVSAMSGDIERVFDGVDDAFHDVDALFARADALMDEVLGDPDAEAAEARETLATLRRGHLTTIRHLRREGESLGPSFLDRVRNAVGGLRDAISSLRRPESEEDGDAARG